MTSKQHITLACLQMGILHECSPELNPFREGFSIQKAKVALAKRIDLFGDALMSQCSKEIDLIVCVEDMPGLGLCSTYLDDPSVFEELVQFSEPIVHACLAKAALHFNMHIVGCYNRKENAEVYNCAVLIDRSGNETGCYRKVHLPGSESWLVGAGDSFPVFETDIGKIGMLICYDDNWPEAATCLMLNGANIICHPTLATPLDFRVRTRAFDNKVYYLTTSRQYSMIAAPNGEILANAGDAHPCVIQTEQNMGDYLEFPKLYSSLYSGITNVRDRHVALRKVDAYDPLVNPDPPAADGIGPHATAEDVYPVHRSEMEKEINGESGDYEWSTDD
ncbi:carbon-nitrogen hydrolase family protein [bacterium AH-315-E10]|nr:carbon-nitrogen hydrolase family protein [bacterium AH-315-E10]